MLSRLVITFLRTDWFDLHAVQGLSRVFSSTTIQKHQFFSSAMGNDETQGKGVAARGKNLEKQKP